MKSMAYYRPGTSAGLRRKRGAATGAGRSAPRPRARGVYRPPAARGMRRRSGLYAGAFTAGVRSGMALRGTDPAEMAKRLNGSFAQWILPRMGRHVSWPAYWAAHRRFVRGAGSVRSGLALRRVLLPTLRQTAAIVSPQAHNEEATLVGVLDQLERLPLAEIVVVVGGAASGSFKAARNHPARPIVVHCDSELGPDVGRAIGAQIVTADIVLFLGGDAPVQAEKLVPFVYAIERGADVALNNVNPFMPVFTARDPVSMVKEFVNRTYDRGDLGVNSLAALPYALSRKALKTIGATNLIVPPKAQAIAMKERLKIVAPASVRVSRFGRGRAQQLHRRSSPLAEEAGVGDHLEALDYMMAMKGERLQFKDALRKRDQTAARPTP
ncbi:glycosyltransferase family A protein [Paenibacillus cymbidii]|uniref:glycosyltransferase family A protein n=1 Tax=Paenibacillus cymbidii TaxID=1639034 RepID=UPI00108075FA|nr:glycosyltransferase family A protein [Paenibacillus cymbidii]